MSTNFPSSADAFTNPTSGDTLHNPPHDRQHTNLNDAMEAVQTSLLDGAPLHIDDANERVGINDTSPSYKLDVNGTGRFTDSVHMNNDLYVGSSSTGGNASIQIMAQAGWYSMMYFGDGGTNQWHYESTPGGGRFDFVESGVAARLSILAGGSVGIGTQSPGAMLDVRGGVQTHRILPFADGTYDLGADVLRWDDVYATNGTIQTSDERDKASVADIDLGLAFVNDLRPVTYTWDDRSGNVGARTHMGFVAQEVATVLADKASNRAVWIHAPAEQTIDPETDEVDEGRDIQGLRYNEFMAPMVKAIQELSATVQTLTARIEALEAN